MMNSTPRRTTSSGDSFELAYWVRRAAEASEGFLLLVHGGASNHTRWSEFTEQTRLAGAWSLVAPDMRGNGESMTRGRQDIALWCDDLADILEAENAPAAVIAGHSLGAQIANHWPLTETPDAARDSIDAWVARRFAGIVRSEASGENGGKDGVGPS